jgi:hypothetical protein
MIQLVELAERWPVEVDRTFACALWTGARDKRDGRALVWRGKTPTVAYRAVYTAEVGPIGDGLVLDHLCRRPSCVALHHLEPVTQSENEKRKNWRYRARRQLCMNGHNLTLNGAITPEGGRVCRACNREALGEP